MDGQKQKSPQVDTHLFTLRFGKRNPEQDPVIVTAYSPHSNYNNMKVMSG